MSHNKEFNNKCPMEGKYANVFKVGQNAFEFLIDFGQSYSEEEKEWFHTRIVSSPFYANILLKTLRDAIHQYEHVNGSIPD